MRNKLNQSGALDPLLFPLVGSIVLLLGITGFAIWSYAGYLDAKEVEQAEIDEAVSVANAQLTEELEIQFAEREKSPVRTYVSPASSGSVNIVHPKTWSVYSEEDEDRGTVEAYLNPVYVKGTTSESPVALRVTIEGDQYERAIASFDRFVELGDAKVSAVAKSGVTGVRIDGQLDNNDTNGSMVVFPLRDKVLKVWTESSNYLSDFNEIVLDNLTFSP